MADFVGAVVLTIIGASAPEPSFWGDIGATPGHGSINIVVERSPIGINPESVRMWVDLSNAGFETTQTYSSVDQRNYLSNYNPQLSDLVFLWDTGLTGQWVSPEKMHPWMNDKSIAMGPWIKAMYPGGTFTPQVTVIEPTTGIVLKASVTFTVNDWNTHYSGSQTVCINPSGVTDTTWGPVGAQYVTMTDAPTINDEPWFLALQNLPRAYLLNPAATYNHHISFDLASLGVTFGPDPMFMGYGGMVDISLPGSAVNSGRGFSGSLEFNNQDLSKIHNIRVVNLRVDGGFDPSALMPMFDGADAQATAFMRFNTYAEFIIHRVEVRNIKNAAFAFYLDGSPNRGAGQTGNETQPGHIHLDDCLCDGHGGTYTGLFCGENDRLPYATLGVTGCRFVQRADAFAGAGFHDSWMRENGHHRVYMGQVEGFGLEPENSGFKLMTTIQKDEGHICNVFGLVSEGNAYPVHICQNIGQGIKKSVAVNAVFNCTTILCDSFANHAFNTRATGVTACSTLVVINDSVPLHANVAPMAGGVMTSERGHFGTGSGSDQQLAYGSRQFNSVLSTQYREEAGAIPTAEEMSAPVRMTGLTVVNNRPTATNRGVTPQMHLTFGGLPADPVFSNVLFEDVAVFGVGGLSGYASDGAFTANELWAPRNNYAAGVRFRRTGTRYPEFTTSPGSWVDGKPDTGSPAIGSGTGRKRAFVDMGGGLTFDVAAHTSLTATTDRGCWKAA